MEKINRILKISVLSLIFTFLSYLYSFKDFLLDQKFSQPAKELLSAAKLNTLEKIISLPEVIILLSFWFLVGAASYYLLFTLQTVYADVAENLYVRFFYKNNKLDLAEELVFNIKKLRRIIIHGIIIFAYTILILTCFFIIPLTGIFQAQAQVWFSQLGIAQDISFLGSLGSSFLIWVIFFNIIYQLYSLAKRASEIEEIKKEHYGN